MTDSTEPVPASVGAGMINTANEQTFPLAKAARKYASSRGDRTIHPATLHRWRSPGIGGIRLSCLKVGGVWHTSTQALQRFFEQLTHANDGTALNGTEAPPRATRKGSQTTREVDDRQEAELEDLLGGQGPRSTKKPTHS